MNRRTLFRSTSAVAAATLMPWLADSASADSGVTGTVGSVTTATSGALTAPTTAVAATGRIDPKLNIQPFLQIGIANEPRKKVRVLVTKRSKMVSGHDLAKAAEGKKGDSFDFIKTDVVECALNDLPKLAKHPDVVYITYDGPVHQPEKGSKGTVHDPGNTAKQGPAARAPTSSAGGIDTSRLATSYGLTVKADKVWNHKELPATGAGVTVAVLDTGVNGNVPDLQGSGGTVSVNVHPSGGQGWFDQDGHGTFIASLITGRSSDGRYIGVAPDARVLGIKIADEQGRATISDLLRGLQWVHNNRAAYNIRIVNVSMSAALPESYRTSPVCAAVEQLWFDGIVVVVAAGNRGSDAGATWFAPANDPYVISVGALDDHGTPDGADNELAPFSARGKTQDGFDKPDVVAPGRRIVGALASSSCTLARTYPDRVTDSRYVRLSGTSFSAPVVCGIVALLLQRFPSLTPDQVKHLLMADGHSYAGQSDHANVVDALKALQSATGGRVEKANQGLLPSAGINPLTGGAAWDQAYWDQAYWDQAYWDQAYWDQAYWDQAYWDQAYWDQAANVD